MAGNHKEFLYLKCKNYKEEPLIITTIGDFNYMINNYPWAGGLFDLQFDINQIKNKKTMQILNQKIPIMKNEYYFNENILHRIYLPNIESNMSVFYYKGGWKAYIIQNSNEKRKAVIDFKDKNQSNNLDEYNMYESNLYKLYKAEKSPKSFPEWFYTKDNDFINKQIDFYQSALQDMYLDNIFSEYKINNQYFVNYSYPTPQNEEISDSRSIINQGAYCYFNTALQCLYCVLDTDLDKLKKQYNDPLGKFFIEKIYIPAIREGKYKITDFVEFIKSSHSDYENIHKNPAFKYRGEQLNYNIDMDDINITRQYTSFIFARNLFQYLNINFDLINGIDFYRNLINNIPLEFISYKFLRRIGGDNIEKEYLKENTKYLLISFHSLFNEYRYDESIYGKDSKKKAEVGEEHYINLYKSQRPSYEEYLNFKIKDIPKLVYIKNRNIIKKFEFIGCDMYSNKQTGNFGHYRWYQEGKPGRVYDDSRNYEFREPNFDFTYTLYRLV